MFGVSRAEFKRLQERIDRLEKRLEYLEYFEERRQAWKRAKNAGRGKPPPLPPPSRPRSAGNCPEYNILTTPEGFEND